MWFRGSVQLLFPLGLYFSLADLGSSTVAEESTGLLSRPLVLHCVVYDPNQQRTASVTWGRGAGGMALHLGTRIHQMANGSLFFASLQEEDLGTYTCSVETESGSVRSLVKVRQAELEDVFFSPQSQTVREGDSVFLQCVSGDSSPAAHISWLKDGQHIRRGTQVEGEYGGGNERKTSGTLHIEDVSIEDKGSYICITHNPLLNISKESNAATLTVQGTDVSLEIVHGPVNTTVATETEAQLHCSVRGYPTPMVQWFKEGQLMGNGSRWSLQNNGQLLVFSVFVSDVSPVLDSPIKPLFREVRRKRPSFFVPRHSSSSSTFTRRVIPTWT